uniref:FABP domain-containing protein n=1 Tax=Syphacia muris TaxID=451379 RepID=A0A0N5A9D8_9BILA
MFRLSKVQGLCDKTSAKAWIMYIRHCYDSRWYFELCAYKERSFGLSDNTDCLCEQPSGEAFERIPIVIMAEQFVGHWKLIESENFEAYLKVLLAFRSVEVTRTGGHWTLKTAALFKEYEMEFDLGVEFIETTVDGRKMQCIFYFQEDGKLVQKETKIKEGDKDSTMIRWIEGDKMIMLVRSGDVESRRVYQKIQ